MNPNDIYDELLEACSDITGLHVAPVLAEDIMTPAIVPDAPDLIDYVQTYSKSMVRLELVFKLVADPSYLSNGIKTLLDLCSFEGDSSVKQAMESATYTALSKPRVLRAENFGPMQFGQVVYIACDLIVEVYASK
jgi:hypothetical protein